MFNKKFGFIILIALCSPVVFFSLFYAFISLGTENIIDMNRYISNDYGLMKLLRLSLILSIFIFRDSVVRYVSIRFRLRPDQRLRMTEGLPYLLMISALIELSVLL